QEGLEGAAGGVEVAAAEHRERGFEGAAFRLVDGRGLAVDGHLDRLEALEARVDAAGEIALLLLGLGDAVRLYLDLPAQGGDLLTHRVDLGLQLELAVRDLLEARQAGLEVVGELVDPRAQVENGLA